MLKKNKIKIPGNDNLSYLKTDKIWLKEMKTKYMKMKVYKIKFKKLNPAWNCLGLNFSLAMIYKNFNIHICIS